MKAYRPCAVSLAFALFAVLLFVVMTGCCPHGGTGDPLAGVSALSAAISDGTATLSWIDPEFDFDYEAFTGTPDGGDGYVNDGYPYLQRNPSEN